MKPNLIRKFWGVSAVCAPKVGAGPNGPKSALVANHLVALSQLGLLRSRSGIKPTWNSLVHQVLANSFGISHLRSLRAALRPDKGYVLQGPLVGVTLDF